MSVIAVTEFVRRFFAVPDYRESTLDLLKRKATEAGLDPSCFDELANLPPEPGSLGPGDPGKLVVEDHTR
jgi:hypothetical protein